MARSFPCLFLAVILMGSGVLSEDEDRTISTDVTETFFLLYTAQTTVDDPVEIPKNVDSDEGLQALESGNFNATRSRTYVVVHGFWSDETFGEKFVPDLLQHEDCNVITVNWPTLALSPYFVQAAQNAIAVGEYAGEFISDLTSTVGLSHDAVHVVGHSFGAQASGHLGRTVLALTGEKIQRISALEPAFPWYRSHDPSLRVSKNDANMVDVWHTNSGPIIDGCLSFPEPMGHLDFYPSGGAHQPGCTEVCNANGSQCSEDRDLIDFLKGGCSHSRSHQFFVESINGEVAFTATQCDSYDRFLSGQCQGRPTAVMGLALDPSADEGSYFLDVNSESPYARG